MYKNIVLNSFVFIDIQGSGKAASDQGTTFKSLETKSKLNQRLLVQYRR